MTVEYADSNVWIAILQGESLSGEVRDYFREVRQARKDLITSVLTLHEISIRAFREGQFARVDEHLLNVNMIAQVIQFTPDIAKTSARLEAKFGEKNSIYGPRLSRWDAMHLATAISYRCSRFLTLDEDLFQINFVSEAYMPHFVRPIPAQPSLQFDRSATGPSPP